MEEEIGVYWWCALNDFLIEQSKQSKIFQDRDIFEHIVDEKSWAGVIFWNHENFLQFPDEYVLSPEKEKVLFSERN